MGLVLQGKGPENPPRTQALTGMVERVLLVAQVRDFWPVLGAILWSY